MSDAIIPLVTTFDQYDLRAKAAFLDTAEQVGFDFHGRVGFDFVLKTSTLSTPPPPCPLYPSDSADQQTGVDLCCYRSL